VFGASATVPTEKIHENVYPSTVLASIVLAAVAAPFFSKYLGPLAVAQARKPRPSEETISEAPAVQPKLARSHTISGVPSRTRREKLQHGKLDSEVSTSLSPAPETRLKVPRTILGNYKSSAKSLRQYESARHSSLTSLPSANSRLSLSSLPDFASTPNLKIFEPPAPAPKGVRPRYEDLRRHTHTSQLVTPATVTRDQQIHALRSHYFRSETQFLTALEGISNRLVTLPKPARLSALRAELALIARDLPAEVDIPLICPATLENGSPSLSRHHRIVRLNPAEATSLNSAERVPYLLMVEVLREDFDFNPDSEPNQRLLSNLITQKEYSRRRFDTTTDTRLSLDFQLQTNSDSVFEPANGDLSSPGLLKDLFDDSALHTIQRSPNGARSISSKTPVPRSSSGANTLSSLSILSTPKSSSSRSSSPGPRRMTFTSNNRAEAIDQPDFGALATHMRTAAQMLAQLDVSGSKRPRHEVESIKTKIIASMQHLEEQNFNSDETTFDTIMANVTSRRSNDFDEGLEAATDPGMSSGAGIARMENDQKTGGVRRKGDRDDPSAATFGEDWKSKRERIRKTSPYGWMKNWDLLSVIVKTGSDLRQEAFACQLIRICAKIWEDAGVPVWVKQMRILVTGESSGLIETITNGVSLHSLKRSLTLATIAAGTNPRKRFATLKDHFVKTFGDIDTDSYKAAEDAFMRSLAAYSILSYILQLKDRHNGNILIDHHGHIIHIDFGFMLSNSPGSVGFEAAPFKLTQDYVDVLGGVGSPTFEGYKKLCKQAFQALRKSAENIVMVVEMMGKESKMACFASGAQQTTNQLRQRFMLHLSREEAEGFVETDLVAKSIGSYYTRL